MSSHRFRFGIAFPALVCAMQVMRQVGWQTKEFQPMSATIDTGSEWARQYHTNSNVTLEPLNMTKLVHRPKKQNATKHSIITKDKRHDESHAAQALQLAVSAALTPDEKRLWFSVPHFSPIMQRNSTSQCPKPVKFKKKWLLNETKISNDQERALRKQLMNGSTTIRNAFMPWLDKGGFHPDLIQHSVDSMGLIVGVFDGKVYFGGKSNLESVAKVRLLAEHLESVMAEFHKRKITIPNVVFPYTVRSLPSNKHTFECSKYSLVPEHLQDRYDTMPAAGIAMDPAVHNGIALMPNMYFGNVRAWHEYTKRLLEGGSADTPWRKRHRRVFWRGKVGTKLKSNIPRLEAIQVAARNTKGKSSGSATSPRLDIALTAGCSEMKKYTASVNRTSPESPPWMPRNEFWRLTKCGASSNKVPHAKFTNYWAQLNLPGSAMGSYSKNLQNLWPTGAAVMMWDQAAVEFYYDTLKAGVTHVWVNESTIEPMAEHLLKRQGKLAQLLGSVGRDWFKKHLTMDAILDYYKQWFHAWAALQRFTPSPDMIPRACTCAGWSDKRTKHVGPRRCSFCARYPANIKRSCHAMMGGNMVKASICK